MAVFRLIPTNGVRPSPDFTAVGAGTYGFTISDSNGTTSTGEVIITQPDEPLEMDLTNTFSTPTNDNENNGSATANAMGGTPPYTFDWSNGGTGDTIESLGAGSYSVTVTDANGCTTDHSIAVDAVTGLLDKNDFEMTLFPNPVKDVLFCRVAGSPGGQGPDRVQFVRAGGVFAFCPFGKRAVGVIGTRNVTWNLHFADHHG